MCFARLAPLMEQLARQHRRWRVAACGRLRLPEAPRRNFRTRKQALTRKTPGRWAGTSFFKRACARIGTALRKAPWPSREYRAMSCRSETTAQSCHLADTRGSALALCVKRSHSVRMPEPRVSGNVLPFGDDRAKLSLGWGIYNAPLNLALIGQAVDQQQLDAYFFDSAGNPIPPSTVTSQFVLPAGGLRQPRFATTSAGWQEKFGRSTLVSLDLLARNGSHGFAFVGPQPSQPGGIFLVPDHRQDRYPSATLSV